MQKIKQPILKSLKRPKYVDDSELTYEVIISKGTGILSDKAKIMLIRIAEEMIKKFEKKYKNSDDRFDCMQQGLLMMLLNWDGFNDRKYNSAFPYFSEICKRGIAGGLNLISRPIKNVDAKYFYSMTNSINI